MSQKNCKFAVRADSTFYATLVQLSCLNSNQREKLAKLFVPKYKSFSLWLIEKSLETLRHTMFGFVEIDMFET